MAVTKHAQETSKRYLNPHHTNKAAATSFCNAVNVAMRRQGSTAIVLVLDKAVENSYRDNWEPNDRMVGIVRGGDLVTVMLSRESQINASHLRTDRIVHV